MTKEEFKKKASKYTKEEIIDAVFSACYEKRESLISCLERIAIDKASKEEEALADREIKAMEDFFAKKREYNEFLFDVAKKHGIVRINEEGKSSYVWKDWFDTATKEEFDEALRLEDAQKKAFDDWKSLERKLDAQRKKADRLFLR